MCFPKTTSCSTNGLCPAQEPLPPLHSQCIGVHPLHEKQSCPLPPLPARVMEPVPRQMWFRFPHHIP